MAQWEVRLSGHLFSASDEENILDAALRAGLALPHACRNGTCERCVGRLVTGEVALPRHNTRVQHEDAQAAQVRCCIAHPHSNCEIQMPNVHVAGFLPPQVITARVIELRPLSPVVTSVELLLPAGRRIQWHPGQYLELLHPDGDAAFSIANPASDRHIELHIGHAPGNTAAMRILDWLGAALTVPLRLPLGCRYLNDDEAHNAPLWFVCGGTGFAQAFAMIRHLLAGSSAIIPRLYWGGHQQQDLYLHDWALAKAQAKEIRYVPVISGPPVAHWRHGLVGDAAVLDLTEPDIRNGLFFVCGSPAMAWATYDLLIRAGVSADRIHADAFDYAPR